MLKNKSIKNKVTITVTLILFVVVLTAIIINFFVSYNQQLSSVKQTQYRVAYYLSEILNQNLKLQQDNVMSFAKALNFNKEKSEIQALLEEYKNLNGFINVFAAFDNDDLFVNSSYKVSSDYDHKTRGWYKDGIKSQGIMLSKPYISFSTGKLLMTFTYPIFNSSGVKGVLMVDLTFDLDYYLQNMPYKKYAGRIMIFHNSGIITSSLKQDYIDKNIKEVFSEKLYSYALDRVSKNKQEYAEPVEYIYNNHKRLAQIVPVKDYQYSVFYEIDENLMRNTIVNAVSTVSIIVLLMSVIGIAILYFIIKSLLSPLELYSKKIYEMVENKDLSVQLKIDNNDELGSILKAINTLNQFTENVVSEVRSSIIEVASANNQLAATMEELSATFNSQSSQVSSMVKGMENVSSISKRTSDALSNNMTSLESTANTTRQETEKLDNVSGKMTVIEQDTVNLSETIHHLSESSAQIGNILNVINDIANQTNLLALNAAIEAARAGEAGRGFAVVADEVRKLAERTQGATKEIEDIITGLLRDADNASTAMTKSVSSVHEGTANITNVTSEIKKAVENVTILYQAMSPVADAVSEQYATIQTVVDNAQVIAAGIEESNVAVNEVNNTVSHIQQRTERLKHLIEQFKTNK